MSVPIRIVFEKEGADTARFHTTFDMNVIEGKYRPGLNQKGENLHRELTKIPGVMPGETSVQLHNNSIWICKLPAFKWEEIKPEVVKVLKELYDLKKIDLE